MNLSEIKKITEIDLGTMGPGLMETFAQAGYHVTGYDQDRRLPQNAEKSSKQFWRP